MCDKSMPTPLQGGQQANLNTNHTGSTLCLAHQQQAHPVCNRSHCHGRPACRHWWQCHSGRPDMHQALLTACKCHVGIPRSCHHQLGTRQLDNLRHASTRLMVSDSRIARMHTCMQNTKRNCRQEHDQVGRPGMLSYEHTHMYSLHELRTKRVQDTSNPTGACGSIELTKLCCPSQVCGNAAQKKVFASQGSCQVRSAICCRLKDAKRQVLIDKSK